MLWSVSIITRTFASVNTCNGSFQSCLKLLKHYRTIEQMCSDAHSITLTQDHFKTFPKISFITVYISSCKILYVSETVVEKLFHHKMVDYLQLKECKERNDNHRDINMQYPYPIIRFVLLNKVTVVKIGIDYTSVHM